MGLLQSLVRGFRGPRRVCTRLPESKAQRIVRWTLFALYVASFFVSALYIVKPFLDPYSIVCRAVVYTFFSPESDAVIAAIAYVPLAVVLVTSLVSRGRFWCNWICPWGTALNEVSMFLCTRGKDAPSTALGSVGGYSSTRGDCIGKGCDKCRKCFTDVKK